MHFEKSWLCFQVTKPEEASEEADPAKRLKVVITADWFIYKIGQNYRAGDYKLDTSKEPRRIEITTWDRKGDKTARGIYVLDGETLKICTDQTPGNEPPSQFQTKPDSGLELLILRRYQPDQLKEDKSLIASRRIRSQENLRQLSTAMHNYHNDFNHFPPAAILSDDGKPLLSWRVAILPYVEQGHLYHQFKLNEPWNSEHNKKLLANMPRIYAPVGVDAKEPFSTFYQVFVGPGTMFESKVKVDLSSGSLFDGASNTIMAVEAGEPVPWTKPDDLPYDPKKPLPKLGGLFADGFNILMADGSVRFVKTGVKEEVLRRAITRNDGLSYSLDDLK